MGEWKIITCYVSNIYWLGPGNVFFNLIFFTKYLPRFVRILHLVVVVVVVVFALYIILILEFSVYALYCCACI